MKKIIIPIIVFIIFSSCKKEAATSSQQLSQAVTNSTVSNSTSHKDVIVRDDLTGFQLENSCTGEILTALSGDITFNFAPDGSLRLIEVHNFILQAPNGTIYRNHYVATFELIGAGGFINTYKMISNPQQGDGTHWVLQGQFKVAGSVNGAPPTVQFDKFFIKCNP